MADKTVLIPGANGQLGRLLRRAWARAPVPGWRPLWCARQPGPGIDAVWHPGDPAPAPAGAVLALWGVVPGRGELAQNTTLARAAMALGRECGAGRVLHCSSAAVYGPGDTLHEGTPCAPANAYGAAKLDMEAAIARDNGPATCAMRLANVVGADSLFRALESDAPMVIDRFPDGQGPRRSYAAPSGILRAVATLLGAEPLPEVINVAAPGTVGMDALARAAGRDFSWRPAPETALAEVSLDTARLQALTGDSAPATAEALIAEWQQLREAPA